MTFLNEGKASYVVVCSILIGDVANTKCTQQEHKRQTTNQIVFALCGQENRLTSFQSVRNILDKATEVSSILTIRSVNVDDSGYYTCSASSVEVKQESTTVVLVHGM